MGPSSVLPYAGDAHTSLSREELDVLRQQFIKEGDIVSVQTKFNYAWGLVKSNNKQDASEGIQILSEIYRERQERRRECLYYLALGHYKLGNFNEAKRCNELLLEKEPSNLQAQSLRSLIDQRVAKEGLIGMAIFGTAVAVGGLVLGQIFKRRN